MPSLSIKIPSAPAGSRFVFPRYRPGPTHGGPKNSSPNRLRCSPPTFTAPTFASSCPTASRNLTGSPRPDGRLTVRRSSPRNQRAAVRYSPQRHWACPIHLETGTTQHDDHQSDSRTRHCPRRTALPARFSSALEPRRAWCHVPPVCPGHARRDRHFPGSPRLRGYGAPCGADRLGPHRH